MVLHMYIHEDGECVRQSRVASLALAETQAEEAMGKKHNGDAIWSAADVYNSAAPARLMSNRVHVEFKKRSTTVLCPTTWISGGKCALKLHYLYLRLVLVEVRPMSVGDSVPLTRTQHRSSA